MFVIEFLAFATVFLCLGSIDALPPEDESSIKEALHPFVMECVEEFGITEEKFEEAKKKADAADIDPCFMSCFMKKAKFFDSDGKLDVENTMSFAKDNLKSEEAAKFFEKFGKECVKVNDEEVSDGDKGCDRAKLVFACIMEVKKKMDE